MKYLIAVLTWLILWLILWRLIALARDLADVYDWGQDHSDEEGYNSHSCGAADVVEEGRRGKF